MLFVNTCSGRSIRNPCYYYLSLYGTVLIKQTGLSTTAYAHIPPLAMRNVHYWVLKGSCMHGSSFNRVWRNVSSLKRSQAPDSRFFSPFKTSYHCNVRRSHKPTSTQICFFSSLSSMRTRSNSCTCDPKRFLPVTMRWTESQAALEVCKRIDMWQMGSINKQQQTRHALIHSTAGVSNT